MLFVLVDTTWNWPGFVWMHSIRLLLSLHVKQNQVYKFNKWIYRNKNLSRWGAFTWKCPSSHSDGSRGAAVSHERHGAPSHVPFWACPHPHGAGGKNAPHLLQLLQELDSAKKQPKFQNSLINRAPEIESSHQQQKQGENCAPPTKQQPTTVQDVLAWWVAQPQGVITRLYVILQML